MSSSDVSYRTVSQIQTLLLSKVVFSSRRWREVPSEVDTKFPISEYYRVCSMVLYYTECLFKMRFILRGMSKARFK